MGSPHRPVLVIRAASAALAAALLAAVAACSSAPEPADQPRAQHADIPAPSLAGNVLGDEPERGIWVYLPPGYFDTDEPLPVVYFLPNHGDSIIHNTSMPADFDPAFAASRPMIIVSISGRNRYDGGFWVDSPVSGNWGSFVADDVVDYVDAHYRTIPDPHARGIAGHAAGGYGALDLALSRPDVFGSAFAFAPWTLAASGPDDGLNDPAWRIETMVAVLESVDSLSAAATLAAFDELPTAVATTREGIDVAYGMAFAPRDRPPFLAYPYRRVDGRIVRDDAVWAEWTRGPGGTLGIPDADAARWGAPDAIGIDCASNAEPEWFVNGCVYLHDQLAAAGVEHAFWPDDGVAGDHIPHRVIQDMIPFFDAHLARAGDAAQAGQPIHGIPGREHVV